MKKDRKAIRKNKKEKEKFKESLKVVQLKPLMPLKYNAIEREKLRQFEKNLLFGNEDKNIEKELGE